MTEAERLAHRLGLHRVGDKESSMSNARLYLEQGSTRKQLGTRYVLLLLLYIVIVVAISIAVSFIPGITGIVAPFIVALLGLILLCYFPCKIYPYYVSTCPYYETPINAMTAYQDQQLLDECWYENEEMKQRWDPKHDVIDQVAEGYCGFASINSVLSSIYKQRLYLQYPTRPKPLTLKEIKDILVQRVVKDEAVIKDFSDVQIEVLDIIVMEPEDIKLEDFENLMKEMKIRKEFEDENGDKWETLVWFIANFNRTNMFFCNLSGVKRYIRWASAGHFSPIITYCYDDNDTMYILIGDVNSSYGNYLCRSDRLYEAMASKQPSNERRGVLKITANRKLC